MNLFFANCGPSVRAVGPTAATILVLLFACNLSPVFAKAPQSAEASTHTRMVRRTIDEQILPLLSRFQDKATALEEAVQEHCKSDNPDGLAKLDKAFADAVVAWAAVSVDRIGPARKKDRATRISFWPDPRGVVRRQVRGKLAASDPALTTPEGVSKQSVALQGLPALELLLGARPRSEDEALHSYRCTAAAAIAANVNQQATEMLNGWKGSQGWRGLMLEAGPDNELYKNEQEAAAEIVKSYLAAVQIVRDSIILPWIEAIDKKKKWAGLPFEASGNSQAYLENTIHSLEELHKTLELDAFAERAAQKDEKDKWIVSWLKNAYSRMRRDSASLDLPAKAALKSDPDLSALKRLKFYTNGLRQIVGRKLVKEAGIFLGFNELDGD